MKVRCYYCDKRDEKTKKWSRSLDKDKQDYVKKNNKNYHTKCYIKFLKNKGKKNNEIDLEIYHLKEKMEEHENKIKLKNKPKNDLCDWIMNYYNIDVLPTGFFHRLTSITKGEYAKARVKISYEELLDIYKKMAGYLNKVAMNKGGFDNQSGRLYWDLAIVVNNYNDYKKWKESIHQSDENRKKIDKMIESDRIVSKIKEKNVEKEFNILDDIEDLLL